MEVSSTSMNVASMTAIAIIHGLLSGRDTVIASIVSAAAAKILLHFRDYDVSSTFVLQRRVAPCRNSNEMREGAIGSVKVSAKTRLKLRNRIAFRVGLR